MVYEDLTPSLMFRPEATKPKPHHDVDSGQLTRLGAAGFAQCACALLALQPFDGQIQTYIFFILDFFLLDNTQPKCYSKITTGQRP
ncbi:hypothetical protein MHK_007079 [Candidatus Magnetomorum sp. HK-1]|nr:hypothetical protein MHK_007079 [Candidatus Magnetomorum sp. HK-1]